MQYLAKHGTRAKLASVFIVELHVFCLPVSPSYGLVQYGQQSAYAKPTLELLRDYHLEYRPVAQATKPVGWATEPTENYAEPQQPVRMQEPALSMRDDMPVYDPLDLRRIGGREYDYLKRPAQVGGPQMKSAAAMKAANYGVAPASNRPLSTY